MIRRAQAGFDVAKYWGLVSCASPERPSGRKRFEVKQIACHYLPAVFDFVAASVGELTIAGFQSPLPSW